MTRRYTRRVPSIDQAGTPLPSLTAVVNHFPAPSQTFIQRKLSGLCQAGMDVRVAASQFAEPASIIGYPYLHLMPWAGVRGALAAERLAAWRATFSALPAWRRQRGRLRDVIATAPILAIDSDIVHFEFSGIAVAYLDRLDELADRARIAVSCRGAAEQIEPLRNPERQRALREVFEAASLIHCVSEDMRATVEAYGADSARILVNRPAVPVADFVPLRHPVRADSGPLRVLSIGRLHWKKGFDDGIRAIAGLDHRGVEVAYRIAGEGPERSKLNFMIDALALGGRVELMGLCDQARIRQLLAWADVVLLPSLSEGISNAVLEAMSAGLPVVSTRCGGMAEVIVDGVHGLLVDIGDADAMAEQLARVAIDRDLRARLAMAAADYADAELDISRQVERFVAAYCRLIGR